MNDRPQVKCQAMGQVCRSCNKANHFAKVCKSNLNRPMNNQRINEIQNSELENITENGNNISLENDIQSEYADSDDDYTVNMLSPTNDNSTPTKLEIQFGNSKYWVMVDSGSSSSLVTEKMAGEIEIRDSNTTSELLKQPHQKQRDIIQRHTMQWLVCRESGPNSGSKQPPSNNWKRLVPSIRHQPTSTNPQQSGR